MHEVLQVLSKCRNLSEQMRLEVFLVGGFVRDLFLGEQSKDVDLLVKGPCLEYSQRLAGELDGRFVTLSTQHSIYRIVLPQQGIQIDITSPVDGQFIKDLFSRDFTCNAVALHLKDYLEDNAWWDKALDPTHGLEDLARRQLRPVGAESFTNDPVRIIRGVRLAAQHGLNLDEEYHQKVRAARGLLSLAPGERIKQEIWQLLAQGAVSKYIGLLDQWHILDEIFPQVEAMRLTQQNHHHAENVWAHCFRTLVELERAGTDYLPHDIARWAEIYLDEKLTVADSRRQLLKLAVLFHDVGKIDTAERRLDGRITFYRHQRCGVPYIKEYAKRLALSKRETRSWCRITLLHMRPLALFTQDKVTDAAYLRFFEEAGNDLAMILLASYADLCATHRASNEDLDEDFVEFMVDLWKRYQRYLDIGARLLLNGEKLLQKLHISPGPLMGELLGALRQAQLREEIKTEDEAVEFAKAYLEGVGRQ